MSWMAAMHIGEISKLDKVIEQREVPVEYFRPTIEVEQFLDGKIRTVSHPLFFNYIFVYPHSDDIEAITRELRDVMRWVKFGGCIAEVDGEVIAQSRLREMQSGDEAVRFFKPVDFGDLNKGKNAEIVHGPFGGSYGEIMGSGHLGAVKLHISCFGRTTLVEVKVDDVELAEF